jgi:hypothetical protein
MPIAPSAKHIGNKNIPYQPYFRMFSNIPNSNIARLQQRKLSFSEWKGKGHEDIDVIAKPLDEASRNLLLVRGRTLMVIIGATKK